MRIATTLIFSLMVLVSSAFAQTAPRTAYWCAATLDAAARVTTARGPGETLGRPRDMLRDAFRDAGLSGVIERVRARVREYFRRHADLEYRVVHGEADIRDTARALARLDGLARDLERPSRTPVRLVVRGPAAIADFLHRQAQAAEELERLHPEAPPRPPFAGEAAVDVAMVIGVWALWTGVTVGLFDANQPWSYFYFLADALVAGLTARPLVTAVGELRQNYQARRNSAVHRTRAWRNTNDEILRHLKDARFADPEFILYSGYTLRIAANAPRPLTAVDVASAALTGTRGRRVRVDQIFQIDPVGAQPVLTLILRD